MWYSVWLTNARRPLWPHRSALRGRKTELHRGGGGAPGDSVGDQSIDPFVGGARRRSLAPTHDPERRSTEAGTRFLGRVKPAMEGVREAFASLSELRDRPAGLLRITLPRLGYESVVGPRLPEFLARYPEIDVELSIDDAFVDVVKEGFDLGMRIGEMLEREMISARVSGDMRVAVVTTPGYFAERGRPKHPRDLQHHDCINCRVLTERTFRDSSSEIAIGSGDDTHVDGQPRGAPDPPYLPRLARA